MSNNFHYKRSLEELRQVASLFWPDELAQKATAISILPLLLETQDDFISILRVSVKNLDGLFNILMASTLSANLFLKHLVILADFGGEMLQRINNEFSSLFPTRKLEFLWNEQPQTYQFKVLPVSGKLTNKKIGN